MPEDGFRMVKPIYVTCRVCGRQAIPAQNPHAWCVEIEKLRAEVDRLARRVDALEKRGTD